ncbi:MAG: ABC transporter ATP-binding protein [Proteobacteria bacterium]|nr:ABC transporter ATP-binding protein [Pseudomonadota bacterium]
MTDGLEFVNVSFCYGNIPAVRDFSLAISVGEIVCLLGPSGCGKTTALRLAAGLESLDQGDIKIAGHSVSKPGLHVPPEDRRIGLVPQEYALFPHLKVLDNVRFGLQNLPPDEAEGKAFGLLARVGLEGKTGSWPHELSGGEQQRVALVRALAPDPAVMLMDEPFSGLDVKTRAIVREETRQILLERQVPSLIVTHDPEEALALGDRIAVMFEGRLVQVGSGDEIYDLPATPFVMELFGAPNRISGQVAGGRVDTPFGSGPAEGFEPSPRVLVMFREDAVRLVDQGSGHKGRIADLRQLGAMDIAVVKLAEPEASLFVKLGRGHNRQIGETVHLSVQTEDFRCFRYDSE